MPTPDLSRRLRLVKELSPLVLCLTNYVTVTDCANAALAIGASPVMSDDPSDAAALAELASALVVNVGTISDRQAAVMAAAHARARSKGIPIILDPVGAGATPRRLLASRKFMEGAAVIRGNASEILALRGGDLSQKGVDSSSAEELGVLEEAAAWLAKEAKAVVAVTGETDIVSDGQKTLRVKGGHVWLTALTGSGCLLSVMVGAYAGASQDAPFEAAAAALTHLKRAGERAAAALPVPGVLGSVTAGALGSYKALLFDSIAAITPEDLA
jgi:hydroxyethylthiazole kinase